MSQPNFPNSPQPGDTYTYSGSVWTWTGAYWRVLQGVAATGGSIVPAANVAYDLGSDSLRWRDLYLSGNSLIIGGATLTATGSAIALPAGSTVGGQSVASGSDVATGGGPKITNVQVTSNSYVVLDDTAVDIAGGYIKITGTGFAAGCQVLINNTPATSTTFIGPTEVRAQLPASSAGTYMLYVINADGGVAIRVNGVTFSATPSWVTASDLTSYSLGDAISIQLSATGASTFALAAGSTLPTGLTLSAGGLLSGSVTGLENDTSYSFTITATDAENQDSPRTFTITITVQLQVSRSLRFNAADTTSLSWIPSNTGNLQTFTISCWIKRSAITGTGNPILVAGTDANDYFYINLTNTDTLSIVTGEAGTANANNVATSAVFRDTGSWYHMVINIDFSNATSTERIRAYVNGTRQTLTGTFAAASFTGTRHNRAGITHYIGRWMNGSPYFSGYITEFYFIDGQALTPLAFAETNTTTGQYIPKKYTGTYGTNGFYLPFTDNSSVLNLGRNYQPLTADPFWNRTVLLLNGTGTNNANNNTFIDSSTNAFAITRNGNTTQGRFSPFTQGGWSNYLNSTSGNYISVSASNAFDVGTNDFTLELWFYINPGATSYNGWGRAHILGGAEATASSRIAIVVDGSSLGSSGLTWKVGSTSGSYATAVSQGQWHHAALIRSGTAITLYLNGSAVSTGTSSASIANNIQHIGALRATDDQFSDYFYGYISNVRFIKNQAVYSGSTVGTTYFTPSTSPLTTTSIGSTGAGVAASITGTVSLLTCQSNRFLDQTGKTITLTGSPSVVAFSPFTPTTAYSAATHGGSAYFDGTGDYLQAAITALTGQFTVEFWFYRPSTGNNFMFTIGDSFTNTGAEVYIGTNGTVLNYYSNGNARITATPPNAGTWSYIAVSRDASNVVRLYVDGTQVGGTYTQAATLDTTLRVGAEYYNAAITGTATGYISGFKVSNTARTITVPTQPLVNDANTVCLLNFTNAGIVDATGDNNIETVGDAKISSAQSKWGSSIYLDGTGDYLLTAPIQIAASNENFTIEYWFYATGNGIGWGYHLSTAATTGTNANSFFLGWEPSSGRLGGNWANASNRFPSGDGTFAGTTCVLNTWYHVALVRISGVMKIYLNGTASATTWSVSDALGLGSGFGDRLAIGYNLPTNAYTAQGYIQDLRITRAARYTGNFTPPTAQFAYNQGDINYNQWVPTNFSVTAGTGNDSVVDSPTNWGVDTGLGGEVRGNYCTLNPNIPPKNSGTASRTLANGNLDLAGVSGGWTVAGGTFRIFAGSGRWYFETTGGVANSTVVGFHKLTRGYFLDAILGYTDGADTEGYSYGMDGNKLNNGGSAYGASWTTSDVIGCAIDASAATASITFYKNGVSQGVAFSNLTGDFIPAVSIGGTGPVVCNFGQRPFAYAAPLGFKSLNTHNLPALAVTKSNTAFDAVLYTGNGSTQTIGGLNFAPDLVWIKDRSSSVVGHRLYDTIRGATKEIYSHATNAETTDAAGLTAFTANGFTTGNSAGTNTNGDNLVAWAWDAGTTTVVNTAGSITASVRVNQTSGFSVVAFTTSSTSGTVTIGHGLGVAPNMIILKDRSYTYNWDVYHAGIANCQDGRLLLNLTDAYSTTYKPWASVASTSTVFSFNQTFYARSGDNIVAYCFAAVPGFSAFGTYTGNGSTDGPFVYLGFRPKFLLTKRADSTSNWLISDTVRNSENPVTRELYSNAPDSEPSPNSAYAFDFLSNGVKLRRATDSSLNISGGTYIYAAFAESPFKYARAR